MAGAVSAPLLVARDGDVVTVTLNRPEFGNAVDLPTARGLRAAISEAESAGASVLVVAARGKVFCAGGDVASMAAHAEMGAYLDELAGTMHEALAAMSASPLFVISAVAGAAAGGGLGLALTADYVMATPAATFLTAYARVGLTPDSGVSALLVRSAGMHRALALAATGRVLTAEEAHRWGLVAEVVPEGEFERVVAERAAELALTAGPALAETKRLIRAAAETGYVAQLEDEQRTIARAAATEHAQSRIRQFTARKPRPSAG